MSARESAETRRQYPLPLNEEIRLSQLDELEILNTPQETKFDAVAKLAASIFNVPVGLVSFVAADEQWFKAEVGLGATGTPRDVAFCSHTICGAGPLVVSDALLDPRFAANPLVVGDPKIRFYAGVPVGLTEGINLGTLCIVDYQPRAFLPHEADQLVWLGSIVNSLLRKHQIYLRTSSLLADLSRSAKSMAEQTEQLAQQKSLLDCGSKIAKLGAFEIDVATGTVAWSDGMYDLHELNPSEEVRYDELLLPYPKSDRERLAAAMAHGQAEGRGYKFESRMYTAKGNLRWVRVAVEVETREGRVVRKFGIKQDITEEKRIADRLKRISDRDDLTGLANRGKFRADVASTASEGGHFDIGFLLVNLERFKEINDLWGHSAGDAVLRRVARRLRSVAGRKSTVARTGSDEFAIWISREAASTSATEALADKIHEVVSRPIEWRQRSLLTSCRIGIASRQAGQGFTFEQLNHEADLALQDAKTGGKNCSRFYRRELDEGVRERGQQLQLARNALAQGQFQLYYQPKLRFIDQSHCGFEALIRLKRSDCAVLAPAAFAAALEDPVLSREIGDFVIDQALLQAQEWKEKQIPFGHIAVNLSASQFRDPDFASGFLREIRAKRLEPHNIEVEVTEGIFMSAAAGGVLSACRELSAAGVRVAFDDFGTGYASLTHLRDFPVSTIKLDRSFVADLSKGGNAVAIVNAMIGLGKSLSMETVAEGVEDPEQAEALRSMGCDCAQGYLYSKPLSKNDAVNYLGSAMRQNSC